jgi:hypothetical protein
VSAVGSTGTDGGRNSADVSAAAMAEVSLSASAKAEALTPATVRSGDSTAGVSTGASGGSSATLAFGFLVEILGINYRLKLNCSARFQLPDVKGRPALDGLRPEKFKMDFYLPRRSRRSRPQHGKGNLVAMRL